MLYYKVFKDFTNFVSIDEQELEKALAAFRFGTAVILNEGALERVEAITPDFNRIMGWNQSYKMGDFDWDEIRSKGIDTKARALFTKTKEKIEFLITTKQEHLIGKNVDIEIPVSNISTEALAQSKKYNYDNKIKSKNKINGW